VKTLINKKNNCLIIGASGFIGSNLTKRLLEDGHYVAAVTGEYGVEHLQGIKDNRLTIHSAKTLKDRFAKLGSFNLVFNLSGYTDIRESYLNPLKFEMNKPITTIKLIQECKTDKFINISTGSVYDFAYNPINELSPLGPASPYAISQLTADYYTKVLCNYRKIPALILRIFNPYGPPNTKKGIISTIMRGLLDNKPVILYNPSRRFDFTYIDDITEAMIFCSRTCRGVINVGNGKAISLLELYKKISQLLNKTYIKPRIEKSSKIK